MNFILKALERLQNLLNRGLKDCLHYSGMDLYVNGGKGRLGDAIRELVLWTRVAVKKEVDRFGDRSRQGCS